MGCSSSTSASAANDNPAHKSKDTASENGTNTATQITNGTNTTPKDINGTNTSPTYTNTTSNGTYADKEPAYTETDDKQEESDVVDKVETPDKPDGESEDRHAQRARQLQQIVSLNLAIAYLQRELPTMTDGRARRLLATMTSYDDDIIKTDLENMKDGETNGRDILSPYFKSSPPDDNEEITWDQTISIIHKTVEGLTDFLVRAMLARYGRDQEKGVDLTELIDCYAIVNAKKLSLDRTFEYLDTDGSGDLDVSEILETLMRELEVEEVRAKEFLAAFDVDKSGTIDKEEFIVMWTKLTM